MKVYCNCMECPNIQKLDAAVDYMPYKGYKPLYEYKFYGECKGHGSDIVCCPFWKCEKCLFNDEKGCLKENLFVDKEFDGMYRCKRFSDKFFSGHMDWSKYGKKKDMF